MVDLATVKFFPGDVVLVHGSGFFDRLIRFGQHLRFNSQDSFYNHAALIINERGDIVEAIASGVKIGNIKKYEQFQVKILHIPAIDTDRLEAVIFAQSRLKDTYGWLTIVSSAFCLLTGLKFSFGFSDTDICSGLVSRALERTEAIFPRDPGNMTPADILSYYSGLGARE